MTAIIRDLKDCIYSRNYANDGFPAHVRNYLHRLTLVSLPFLTLHKPFRQPVSLGMGTLRVYKMGSELWNCKKSASTIASNGLSTALATIALSGSFFGNSKLMAVTTIKDTLIELQALLQPKHKERLLSLAKIVSNLFFITVIFRGGMRISIVAFLMQSIVSTLSSVKEFKRDRYLEGGANLLMSFVRLKQTYSQYNLFKRNQEIEAAIKQVFVGKLGRKWQFPSDHLPVGIEVNGIKIISWNVLNTAFMSWVTDKDSQGLNGSMLTDLNTPAQENGLTNRDLQVIELIQSMTKSGLVIALQECGLPFIEALQQRLPSHWQMIKSFNTPQKDQLIMVYDASRLTYQPDRSETCYSAYVDTPKRHIQNALFSTKDQGDIRVINGHIPGDPKLPSRDEFAHYVYKNHSDATTVALGDNNFDRDAMKTAYQKAGFSEYSLHSPWKTNINPETKQSIAIDHIFVIGNASSRDLKPTEVLKDGNLEETIGLLNKSPPKTAPRLHSGRRSH